MEEQKVELSRSDIESTDWCWMTNIRVAVQKKVGHPVLILNYGTPDHDGKRVVTYTAKQPHTHHTFRK